MATIKKLSSLDVQKIAAGEVVERPANVVKELVENALDAGATAITVSIEHGGRTLIRVVDNGCGMSSEDALLAFEHHATSKINSVHDLDQLTTFGFRGEALSSIASMSKVTLVTRSLASPVATKIYLEQNQSAQQEEVAAPVGTDITVRDLYFNVPARLKFLKKDETEYRHIYLLMQSYCFAYKYIHFKFMHNGTLIYNCPPVQEDKQRVAQVWDSSFSKHLITIEHTSTMPSFSLRGVITDYQHTQYSKQKVCVFVNKRFVKNIELSRALLKGYAHVLPDGKFPSAVIFIEVPPAEVDVNVHPRKEEVKLLHSHKIEQALQTVVRQALEQTVSHHVATVRVHPAQSLPFEKSLSLFAMETNELTHKVEHVDAAIRPAAQASTIAEFMRPVMHASMQTTSEAKPFSQEEAATLFGNDVLETPTFSVVGYEQPLHDYAYIGQFKKTYLLFESADGLVMIDQHAAHESILYDLFMHRFQDVATVKLLFPHVVRCSKSDRERLVPYLPLCKRYGIDIEIFGEEELVITSTPVHLKNDALDELMSAIFSWIHEAHLEDETSFMNMVAQKLCAQMACKAAIKAGDAITSEEVKQLLEDLSKTTNRFSCPHGRPTLWNLSLNEIEKKFKRKV